MQNNIKQLREKRGLTLEELGKALGFDPQMLNGWEHGAGSPTVESLARVAEFFDVSIDYLVGHNYQRLSNGDEVFYREDGEETYSSSALSRRQSDKKHYKFAMLELAYLEPEEVREREMAEFNRQIRNAEIVKFDATKIEDRLFITALLKEEQR